MDSKQAVKMLRFAADTVLCEHPSQRTEGPFAYSRRFSRDAVRAACTHHDLPHQPIWAYLETLGVLTECLWEFEEFSPEDIQGTRFLWLDFAALVLEDQPELFPGSI